MLFLFRRGAFARSSSVAWFLFAASGCAGTRSSGALDRTFEATHTRVAGAPRESSRKVETADDDPSGVLDRDVIVAQAIARSPALRAMAHRARALVHAGRADGSLPPAELAVEARNFPLSRPYAIGEAEMYMVELRQRFPVAGSLDALAQARAEQAQAVLAELSSQEQLIAERAASAFADYVQAVAEQRLQERQLTLLSRMAQAVRARYTTGGTALVGATRIDVEISNVQRALVRVGGQVAGARARLNALLKRPAGAPLGQPRQAPPQTVRLSLDELLARTATKRGAILSADARARAAEARREAAQAEADVPEFMLGLGYWQDPNMRPGLGISASMTLPWLWGPNRERTKQAEEEVASELAERDAVRLDAQAEIGAAHARLQALEAQLSVIHDQALPAIERSLQAVTAAFSTGSASLPEWVELARSGLALELESVSLQAELARTLAELERAVGASLPRSELTQDVSK